MVNTAQGRLHVVWLFEFQRLASLSGGVTARVGGYLAGPWVATTASGVGGFVTAIAVQAGVALRRLYDSIAAAE